MIDPKKLLKAFSRVEKTVDRMWFATKKKLNRVDPIVILPYCGYGNYQEVMINGRVLEKEKLADPNPEDSTWDNIVAMWKRYTSEEVPYVKLKATFQNQTKMLETDDEGYFEVTFSVDRTQLKTDSRWHEIYFELLEEIVPGQGSVTATGDVLVLDQNAEFGVISDVDDTVLISHSTQLFKVLKLSLSENATTRMPFHGVSAFYEALRLGKSGHSDNPFFYVSSSPWNIYDVIAEFFRINEIPDGPILLRDLGISETKFIKERHTEHKPVKIRQILDTYPDLPFILIGDSGQHDPEIYHQIIEEYPGRILATYIRDHSLGKDKMQVERLETLSEGIKVEMVLCGDTEAASEHALSKGYIISQTVDKVKEKTKKDESPEDK